MSLSYKILIPLLKGSIVKHPAAMKRTQVAINIITPAAALVSALVPATQPYLTTENLTNLFALISALNLYFTTASTDKIGL